METFKDLREEKRAFSTLSKEEKLALFNKFIDETEPVASFKNGRWEVKEGEEWLYEPY